MIVFGLRLYALDRTSGQILWSYQAKHLVARFALANGRVYALDDLRSGERLHGPAIIEAETTTVVINAGDELAVNALGWLEIRVARKLTAES